MSRLDWAKEEIKFYIDDMTKDNKEDGWTDYIKCAAESALKAYESLLDDGHSGMSIDIAKHILNKLIDGKSLTPIQDIPEVWNSKVNSYDDSVIELYQCKRNTAVFKHILKDGSVYYSDNNRIIFYDNNIPWHSGPVCRYIEKLYPMTMPYIGEVYKVYGETYFEDEEGNIEYDAPKFNVHHLTKIVKPDGTEEEVDVYLKDKEAM